MVGASDDYTAAGSLYFSNLIYKLKLLEERGGFVPKKYNGMRVVLSQRGFGEAYDKFRALKRTNDFDKEFQDLLMSTPNNAKHVAQDTMSLDEKYLKFFAGEKEESINNLFKQINSVSSIKKPSKDLIKTFKILQPWATYFSAENAVMPEIEGGITYISLKPVGTKGNANTEQLRRTLNQTVLIVRKRAVAQIKSLLVDNEDINHAKLLHEQYLGLGDALDRNADLFSQLDETLTARAILTQKITTYLDGISRNTQNGATFFGPSQDEDSYLAINCPLPFLCELKALNQNIERLTHSNESLIILKFMGVPSPQAKSDPTNQEDSSPPSFS